MEESDSEGGLHATPSDGSLSYPSPDLGRLSLESKRSGTDALFGERLGGSPRCLDAELAEAAAPLALPPAEAGHGGGAQLLQHPKHVLVFSNAGKPVYSYRGSEEELAGLMATAHAIMAVAQSRGESLRHVAGGGRAVAFLDRGPLRLLAASSLAEPPAVLRMQLALVHGQVLSLLTGAGLEGLFRRSPGYDVRKLLGGADAMLTSLIDSFGQSPAALLGAFSALPLPPAHRSTVMSSLQAAVAASGAVFGLVVCGQHVAALAGPPGQALQQWDVLLLLNFLRSSRSLWEGEAFVPICLPHYNSAANLHAYVHYLDVPTETAVVLLAGGAQPEFHPLSEARQQMQRRWEEGGALEALLRCARERGTAADSLAVHNLPPAVGGGRMGATPLLQFVYKATPRQQFLASPLGVAQPSPELQQHLVVAYSQMRAAMFEQGGERVLGPLQQLRYEARERYTLVASATPTAELFLALDPLVDRAEALALCAKLGRWLSGRHDQLFT